jgi:hypothetical protein
MLLTLFLGDNKSYHLTEVIIDIQTEVGFSPNQIAKYTILKVKIISTKSYEV